MQNKLIEWYYQNRREFPWRQTTDPYHIWISEIMLQQTTTEAVIPYYENFLRRFPTINDWQHLHSKMFIKHGKDLVIIDAQNIFMKQLISSWKNIMEYSLNNTMRLSN